MKLSAKAITTYNHVNSFNFGNQWSIRSGEANTLYFQIVDLDQASLRYIVGVGLTSPTVPSIAVTFPSIDDDDIIVVTATQVDPLDGSLWKIDLLADQVPSSGNVFFAITEGPKTRRFSMLNFIIVESATAGECC